MSSEGSLDSLQTSDSQLTAQAAQRSSSRMIGSVLGAEWMIVVEGGSEPVLFHAFVAGPEMMSSTLPRELMDVVGSLTVASS
jgi:hypothetical protein